MLLIRFLQTVIVLCLVGIVLVIFQSGATAARQTVFVRDVVGYNSNQVLNLDKPEIARTFYGELKGLGRPAIFSFKAEKGTLINARIYIPRLEGLEDFRPALAFFGPGLPAPTADQLDRLPFTVPEGQGLITSEETVKLNVNPPPLPEFDEPFTQSAYWEGQELQNETPDQGTYYLAVFSRVGQGGKYALQLGTKAEAGLKETLAFPVVWSRVHLWFGDWLTAVLVWLALALLALYGFYRLVRPWLTLRRKVKFAALVPSSSSAEAASTPSSTVGDKPVWSGQPSKYAPAPKFKSEE